MKLVKDTVSDTFQCKMCGTMSFISTENYNETQYLPINRAMINGSLAIGMLYS